MRCRAHHHRKSSGFASARRCPAPSRPAPGAVAPAWPKVRQSSDGLGGFKRLAKVQFAAIFDQRHGMSQIERQALIIRAHAVDRYIRRRVAGSCAYSAAPEYSGATSLAAHSAAAQVANPPRPTANVGPDGIGADPPGGDAADRMLHCAHQRPGRVECCMKYGAAADHTRGACSSGGTAAPRPPAATRPARHPRRRWRADRVQAHRGRRRHQQRQAREQRQNVGQQLGVGCRKEHEYHGTPHPGETPRVKARPRRRATPATRQRTQRRQQPRQIARQQNRNEEPPGLVSILDLGQIALKVFANKEELKKLRQPVLDQDQPRQTQQPNSARAAPQQQPTPRRKIPLQCRVDDAA